MEAQLKTLDDAITHFSDHLRCVAIMRRIKWPSGNVSCPRCKSSNVAELPRRSELLCKTCSKQFSLKVGTIFEGSRLNLSQLLVLTWVIETGCEEKQSTLAKRLGLSKNSVSAVMRKLRDAIKYRWIARQAA